MTKLSGEMQINALDFVTFLREKGMTIHDEHSTAFMYNGKWVCIIIIFDNGGWMICDNPLTKYYDDFPVDEELKQFALDNVRSCGECGCSHEAKGITKSIFGKKCENLCSSEVQFFDPDTEALSKIKQLINAWIESENTVK